MTLAKEEWELTRLKALRQEEERRAELEEDEMLFTYSRHDAYNQVKKKSKKSMGKKERNLSAASTPRGQVPPGKGSSRRSVASEGGSVGSSPESETSRKTTSRVTSRRSSVNSQTSSTSVGSSKSGKVKEEGRVKVEKEVVVKKEKVKSERGDGDGENRLERAKVKVNGPSSTSTPVSTKPHASKRPVGRPPLQKKLLEIKPEAFAMLSPEEKKIMTRARHHSGEVLATTPTGMTLRKPLAINIHSDHGLVSLPMVTSPKQRPIQVTPGSPRNKTAPTCTTSTPNTKKEQNGDKGTPKCAVSQGLNIVAAATPPHVMTAASPNVSPIVPQPWSNPNLVIRTRRASAKEAKKRPSQEGETPEKATSGPVAEKKVFVSSSASPIIVTSSAPKTIKVPLTSVVGGISNIATVSKPLIKTINAERGPVSVINSSGGMSVINNLSSMSLVNSGGSIVRTVPATNRTNMLLSTSGGTNVLTPVSLQQQGGVSLAQAVSTGVRTVQQQGVVRTIQQPGVVRTVQQPGVVRTVQQQGGVSLAQAVSSGVRTITTSSGSIRLVQTASGLAGTSINGNKPGGMVLLSNRAGGGILQTATGQKVIHRTSALAHHHQMATPNNTVPILEKLASQVPTMNNVVTVSSAAAATAAAGGANNNPSSNTVPILEKMAMQLQGYGTAGGAGTTRPQQIIIVQSRPQQQQTLIQQPAKVASATTRPQQILVRTQSPAAAGGASRPQQVYIHTRQGGQQVLVPIQTLTGATGNTINLASLQNLQARSQVTNVAVSAPRVGVTQTVTSPTIVGSRPQTITVPISALQGRTAGNLQTIQTLRQGATNITLTPRQPGTVTPVRQTILRHPQQFIVQQPGKQPQQVILQSGGATQQLLIQQAKQGAPTQQVILKPQQTSTVVAAAPTVNQTLLANANSLPPGVKIISAAAVGSTPVVTNVTTESLDTG